MIFDTGATREDASDKLDYEGFLSPQVLERFAEYMHKHRKQADGSIRDSDNWQKGMPLPVYMKSLLRHVMAIWKWHRNGNANLSIEDELCGVLFNTQGYLLSLIKNREANALSDRLVEEPRSPEDWERIAESLRRDI